MNNGVLERDRKDCTNIYQLFGFSGLGVVVKVERLRIVCRRPDTTVSLSNLSRNSEQSSARGTGSWHCEVRARVSYERVVR